MNSHNKLIAATKEFIESLHPEAKNVEIAGVNIEMEHYPTTGCSCRDDECDITNTLDIWYSRDRIERDNIYRLASERVPERTTDFHSVDAESIHFTEYITFLANWDPKSA